MQSQIAFFAFLVRPTPPVIILVLHLEAGGDALGPAEQRAIPLVLDSAGGRQSIEAHYPVAELGQDGQTCKEVAVQEAEISIDGVWATLVGSDQPQPDLLDFFACAQEDVPLPGAASIFLDFFEGQPSRILRLRGIQRLQEQGDLGGIRNIPLRLAAEMRVPRSRMVAVAVLLQPACAQVAPATIPACISLCGGSQEAKGSSENASGHARVLGGLASEDLDDTAGGIAIEGGRGATYHFNPVGHGEVEVVDLCLAIGECRGESVDQYLDLPNSEGGARPEAANLNAGILREVSAFLNEQTRDAGQRFPQRYGRPREAERVGTHNADAGRSFLMRSSGSGPCDDKCFDRCRSRLGCRAGAFGSVGRHRGRRCS